MILILSLVLVFVVGFLTYTKSRDDAAAHRAMVFAAILFLVGAFYFVRAAKESPSLEVQCSPRRFLRHAPQLQPP